ncbi:hypothetical protein [Candidatus Phytoplasma melaleucae]|uniref:Uncharacterized protein n=1 Tax=Candidatus Phytoplasma melaleucae TaxID=2982630 RepID=A0ABT9DDX9_9MOLU|nr:hypothetical protein ['Melaleuca sp.' phytoplasma]MDO8168222.1 hypothetical protein ['Melaleuca sp.' phytoplasma]
MRAGIEIGINTTSGTQAGAALRTTLIPIPGVGTMVCGGGYIRAQLVLLFLSLATGMQLKNGALSR